jgi:hypothetical protein
MEHGRDVVFYGPNGLDGQSLYACVIKNSPITGEAGSCDSVRTVSDQAKEAFQHPYTNPDSGREEQVRVVWVMSPYECTPIAVESISSQLRGIGSVEFCCGASLLDLFAKHLQLFLLESNVLASYLSALRTGLQTDTALLRIILQKTILADVPMDFGAMYVPQNFAQTLRQVSVEDDLHVTIALKEQNVRQEDVRKLEGRLNRLQRLIDYLADADKMQLADLAPGIAPQEVFGSLILEVRDEWTQAYKAHVAEVAKEFKATMAKRKGIEGPPAIPPGSVALKVNFTNQVRLLHGKAEELRKAAVELLKSECSRIQQLTPSKYSNARDWLAAPELKSYCSLLDLDESLPGVIRFQNQIRHLTLEQDFLTSDLKLVILSGPAGFGKTSFCKHQAIADAEAMLAQDSDILPVFVPLYKFAYGVPNDVVSAFFDSPELKTLINDTDRNTKVRLFLDGLDEVPNKAQQAQIVELATTALEQMTDLQIVITARDHVVGPWLDGIVRLKVQPLNEIQQKTLVTKWLGSVEATNAFFSQLTQDSPLRPLLGVPLLANLIAAVYKKQQYLPPNRTALYSLFIELLCGGWDTVKGIKRQDRFGVHDKRLVLARLAVNNHLSKSRDASIEGFRAAVKQSLSKLAEHSGDLLTEILQDGLLVSTGNGLRFSHLSFQEYLAADFFATAGPYRHRAQHAMRLFYAGEDWWKEVLNFYVTSTSDPADMEEWLIERAKDCRSSLSAEMVLNGQLDERLGYLRKALREAFPSYSSKYPVDGIITETTGRGSSVTFQRRTLTGLRIEG